MITTDAHLAALDWTGRALSEELPNEEASSIATRAEMLTAIAAAEGVPIEVLIQWIHTRVPGKIWSGEEWRRFSAKYSRTVRNL
jgi:hypothetical protein